MASQTATQLSVPGLSPFERITRQVRWLALLLLVVTFPYAAPQAHVAYLALGIAAVYNLLRYAPAVYQSRWLSSPVTVLAVDLVLATLMMMIVGNVATPYTGLLILL
ncbi:MAG TPA: hypothetical protein VI322_00005, partial [Candidatus Saccharimonadia bacterium]